jgi:hypothetical protein
MAVSDTLPLAQLVDALPSWEWYALLVGGMLAPVVGLLIAHAGKTATQWKRTAVGLFYLISLPLLGLVVTTQTENPWLVCSFLLLLPVGIILGLVVLAPHRRLVEPREPRGLEVQPKPRDKADADQRL